MFRQELPLVRRPPIGSGLGPATTDTDTRLMLGFDHRKGASAPMLALPRGHRQTSKINPLAESLGNSDFIDVQSLSKTGQSTHRPHNGRGRKLKWPLIPTAYHKTRNGLDLTAWRLTANGALAAGARQPSITPKRRPDGGAEPPGSVKSLGVCSSDRRPSREFFAAKSSELIF
jgi:hypothetical protein